MDKMEVKLLLGRPTFNLRIRWQLVASTRGTKNRVVGSIQSPIFGGFLPLSIPISEKVHLVGLEMSTGNCSKCSIEKTLSNFPCEISLREDVNLTVWIVTGE